MKTSFIQKAALSTFIFTATLSSIAYATDTDSGTLSTIRTNGITSVTQIISNYEAIIAQLQSDNAKLRVQIMTLKNQLSGSGTTTTSTTSSSATTIATSSSSSGLVINFGTGITVEKYKILITKANEDLANTLAKYNLASTGAIGLFEFIEPNAFFISIDDGQNPSGVTAFKEKILYTYDSSYNLTTAGVFSLNYTAQKYVTVSGSNPYTKAIRIRIRNPLYKGKLLEEVESTTTSSGTTSTTSSSTLSSNPTIKEVQAAYAANKLYNAITLANNYLANNGKNVEVLTVRYRSYFMTKKYTEALADIADIVSIAGTSTNCTITKDGAMIAKINKNTTTAAKYSAMACTK